MAGEAARAEGYLLEADDEVPPANGMLPSVVPSVDGELPSVAPADGALSPGVVPANGARPPVVAPPASEASAREVAPDVQRQQSKAWLQRIVQVWLV